MLPVVPQTVFLLLAAILLFPSHPRVQKLLAKFAPRYPKIFGWLAKLGIGLDKPDMDIITSDDEVEAGNAGGAHASGVPSGGWEEARSNEKAREDACGPRRQTPVSQDERTL